MNYPTKTHRIREKCETRKKCIENRERVPPLEDASRMTKSTVFFATFETCSNCSQTPRTYGSIANLEVFNRKCRKCAQTITTPGSIANFAKCIFDVKNASDFTRSEILQNPGKCCSQDHFGGFSRVFAGFRGFWRVFAGFENFQCPV